MYSKLRASNNSTKSSQKTTQKKKVLFSRKGASTLCSTMATSPMKNWPSLKYFLRAEDTSLKKSSLKMLREEKIRSEAIGPKKEQKKAINKKLGILVSLHQLFYIYLVLDTDLGCNSLPLIPSRRYTLPKRLCAGAWRRIPEGATSSGLYDLSVNSVGHSSQKLQVSSYVLYEFCCTRCLSERFVVLHSTDVHDLGMIGTEQKMSATHCSRYVQTPTRMTTTNTTLLYVVLRVQHGSATCE